MRSVDYLLTFLKIKLLKFQTRAPMRADKPIIWGVTWHIPTQPPLAPPVVTVTGAHISRLLLSHL